MREDSDNGDLCRAAAGEGIVDVSFPVCLGSCLQKSFISGWGGKKVEREELWPTVA